MNGLFRDIFDQPASNANILLGSAFIHLLGLAPTFYVVLVFGRYLPHGVDATLLTLTVGTVAAMVMERLLRRVRARMLVSLLARRDRVQSTETIHRLLLAPVEQLQTFLAGERLQSAKALEQVNQALSPSNLAALIDAPFFLLFWLVLMLVSWQLGLVAAVVVLGAVVYILAVAFAMRGSLARMNQARLNQQSVFASAERLEAVRLANAGGFLARKFEMLSATLRLSRYQAAEIQERMQLGTQLASGLLTILTISLGAKLATTGYMDVGVLFGANILAGRILNLAVRPAQFLSTLFEGAQADAALLRQSAVPVEASEGTTLPRYDGRLEFKDVAFGYPGGTGPLFENLSFRLRAGELLLVTGSNSTGKSTFARLTAGLLTPTRGAILGDGVDIRQFVPGWWRSQMIHLPQEPEFFDGSLRENLATLAPDLSPERLKGLLEQVGLATFVDHHPQGMLMPVLNGGRQFSPGIRRRIALARALTTGGRLVVMDEPLEGLDAQGVAMMNAVLNTLRREGRTLILCTQMPPAELCRIGTVVDLNAKPEPKIEFGTQGRGAQANA